VYLGTKKDALDSSHNLGLMSEREYANQLIAIYKEEHDAQQRYLQNQIDSTADPDTKLQLQKQLTEEATRYNAELVKTNTALDSTNRSWTLYFGQMKTQTQDLGMQIRTSLQSSLTQFTNAATQDFAKCIVEGKNFGQAIRRTTQEMSEEMISMLAQWGIKWVMTHTLMRLVHTASNAENLASTIATTQAEKAAAAALAGANAAASFSLAPWPIDMGAPAFGASMMGAAMSFEVGGKIPGSGAVPIIGHGGETVVTKALTDRVEASEGRGGGGNTHTHLHYAPQIHAIDADGVEGMLKQHSDKFMKHMNREIRRGAHR
jgi:hypothetical protein